MSVSVSGHGHGHGHVYVTVYVYVCVCVRVRVWWWWWWAKSGETPVEASRDTNAQIVRYTNRTISRLVLPTFPQDC